MNLEKFTDRAKGFLQAAQTIAIRMNHQRISPEHIAKALLEGSGARLEFANAAGRGARITVTWSRAAIAADDRGALGPNPEIHG